MRVPLNVLLYTLSPKAQYEAKNLDFASEYQGVKLFDANALAIDMDPDYIYMVSEQAFSVHLESWKTICYPEITLVCLKNEGNLTLEHFHEKQAVIILDPPKTFSHIFNRIVNIFSNINYWNQDVHMALLQGKSMQDILNLTERYVNHSMVVLDRSFSLLGYIKKEEDIEVLNSIIEQGYVTSEMMAFMRKEGVISTASNIDNPLINYYTLSNKKSYYSMMYQFKTRGKVAGYVIVFRCEVHPKTNFLYAMNLIANNLALYFQQERKQNASADVYETILTEILETDRLNIKAFEDKLSYIHGLPVEGRFLLAHVDYENEKEMPYYFVCWSLRSSFNNLKPFVFRDHLYMLRVLPDGYESEQIFTPEEEYLFKSGFRGFPYICGVSQMFFSLEKLKRALWQCDEAVRIHAAEKTQKIHYFKDNYLNSFLEQMKENGFLEYYTSPDYEILKQYDSTHNTDLCDLYMKYLENGSNINQTASATFLHRNTVLNKIKKAISIMPKGSSDYQRMISFVMSYKKEHLD